MHLCITTEWPNVAVNLSSQISLESFKYSRKETNGSKLLCCGCCSPSLKSSWSPGLELTTNSHPIRVWVTRSTAVDKSLIVRNWQFLNHSGLFCDLLCRVGWGRILSIVLLQLKPVYEFVNPYGWKLFGQIKCIPFELQLLPNDSTAW